LWAWQWTSSCPIPCEQRKAGDTDSTCITPEQRLCEKKQNPETSRQQSQPRQQVAQSLLRCGSSLPASHVLGAVRFPWPTPTARLRYARYRRWSSRCRRSLCLADTASARCPSCQSSCRGVALRPPRIRNCGTSRRLRLSSAKPGNLASVSTACHNGTASASLGMREITGPKNDSPSGGSKVMIGVPTLRPVRLRTSSVSASSSTSHLGSSAAAANAGGRPTALSTSVM